jgi:hypothetical protein
MRNNFFCGVAAVALVMPVAVVAQETTSTIRGTVTAAGAPVAGATVTVVNVPSGTRATVTTNAQGSFNAAGLRPGGPYTVSVEAQGFNSTQVTDIQTVVAQPYDLPVELTAVAADAAPADVVVTASRIPNARSVSQGPANVLTANQISKITSVNRDIRDLMQRDPFASLDTSQGAARQVSFAGVNPRFNRFTVDGVPLTDSFGLNPDALPSRRGPVPLDSIGQFETKVAPYDIREGFFQGGVVNAILKSGTNSFHGTGFFTYSDDSLNGNKTKPFSSANGGTNADGSVTLPPFQSRDFGATLSGPIIKDKLFFMVSAERVRASLPLAYGGGATSSGGSPFANLSNTVIGAVSTIAQNQYGVNAGGILTSNGDQDDRIVGKIDANITDTQRLAITGIYTRDQINTLGSTSSNVLPTTSDDYIKPDRVFAGVVQLNSDWTPTLSTETRIRYKDYKSGQTPLLANTALATVCTDAGTAGAVTVGSATSCSPGVPSVLVGPQTSAQANILRVKTFGASEVVRVTAGDHVVRGLFEFENANNYDLFVNGANGSYYFDSIAAFNARTAQTFSYTNATTLNPVDASAIFTYQTYTFGLQDDWRISDQFHVSLGLRYDLYGSSDRPPANANYLRREGFSNQAFISGKSILQPRIGFNYEATPRLSIRGGGGIFGGGTPDVYVGNSFSASGAQPVSITQTQCAAALTGVSLTQIPAACNVALQNGTATANGNTSAIAPNFKIPSYWRTTLSVTHDTNLGPLGDHWQFGADGLYTKTRNAILVQDFRNRPIAGSTTPDGRQRYYDVVATIPGAAGTCTTTSTTCNDSQGDYVLTNTSKGRSVVVVGRVSKAWDFGLSAGGSFTYQDVKDQQALTSSVASSNYNNGAYYDPNSGAYGHSNDEVKYQFKYNIDFDHAFFGDYRTRIDLFGVTRIGSPYSFTFQDISSSGASRSTVFGTVGSNSHYLFYVPTGLNDPKVVYDTPATQSLIDNLINNTGLKNYRGQVAPRNGFHSKWFSRLDLHVEQELPTFVGKSKISVFGDIENFTNLLNKNWGEQLRASFPYNKVVTQVSCVAAGNNPCAQYKYTAFNPTSSVQDQLIALPSLYTIRVGARLSF